MRFFTVIAALLIHGAVYAQDFPTKPIRFVVPYGAGGTSDAIGRQVAHRMSETLKQSIVVENKAGAGGTVGTAQVAKAPADGYSVLVTLSSHTINPGLYKNLPYDTEKDLKPITLLANGPQVLAVNPGVPANNLKEYLDWLKRHPEQANYATGGNGTPGHLAAELLSSMSGVKMQHIPYKGGGGAVTDVIGGQVGAVWVTAIAAIPHIKAGKLRALAVTTRNRVGAIANVPTMAESGFPGYAVDAWVGMFVPAATPQAVVDVLYKAAVTSLSHPELRATLQAQGSEVLGPPPKEAQSIISDEIRKWRTLIGDRGIKPD